MDGDLSQLLLSFAPSMVAHLIGPFTEVLLKDSLIWWPFLVSTFCVGAIVFWHRDRRGLESLHEFRRRYLSRAIWAHRSAQADYAFFIVNGVLSPFIVTSLVLSAAAVANAMHSLLAQAFGVMTVPLADGIAMRVGYTLAFFVAYDFGRYVSHKLLHVVPLLWDFHKTHHSAEVLTPLSNYRVHPVDLFVTQICPNLATGLISGIFYYLCGGAIGFYSFLGLHVFIAAFNSIGNLRHWHVWVTYGPLLDRWLISPAHHQLHHSLEPRHRDKNLGYALAIWDRMFGSLYVPVTEEPFRMGLGDGTDGEWHTVGRLYFRPFRHALGRLGFARAPRAEGNMP
jgi:sterol desaturase/sphingolipid hydroxylase (fatty acid hydroxylase superfamily)